MAAALARPWRAPARRVSASDRGPAGRCGARGCDPAAGSHSLSAGPAEPGPWAPPLHAPLRVCRPPHPHGTRPAAGICCSPAAPESHHFLCRQKYHHHHQQKPPRISEDRDDPSSRPASLTVVILPNVQQTLDRRKRAPRGCFRGSAAEAP